MKQKLFTLLTLLVCAVSASWAADAVSATRTYSNGNATCTWTITAASVGTNVTTPFGADGLLFTTVNTEGAKGIALGDSNASLKLNTYGNAIYVEVPSSTSHGTITLKSTGNNTHRTVNLKSGTAIGMNSSTGITANFVASDLEEVSGSYYIKLVNTGDGTSDASADYKIAVTNGISVTLTDETYTVTTPTITLDKNSAIIRATESGTAATATINVTAANLTASGTLNATMSPSVDNLSVSPTSVSIAADGSISSTDLTVSFTATSNVTSGSTTLTLSDGTTSVDVPIYYSAVITPWTLQSISESTTWTFDDTNIPSGSLNQNTSAIYANIDGMAFGSDFDATALELGNATWPYYSAGKIAQAKSFKFNTTVPGTVKVTYNKASGDVVYISVNSADNGSASSTTTTDAIAVSAGDVVIAGYTSAEHTEAALLNVSKIEFVKAVAVTGVELNKTSTSIEVGATETLTATVAPADATNKSVTWSSSNETIATVDGGIVTGVAAGTATITVTTEDGSFTATCTVTVVAAQAPIVTLPTARDGYSVTSGGSAASSGSYSNDPLKGETLYTLNKNTSYTLTIPGTTNVSKISIIGVTDDNNETSTVTITGANSQSANATFVVRKSENPTTLDFIPSSQTTTYTIAISNNKNVVAKIAIYGEEFVLTPKKTYTTLTSAYNLDFTNVTGLSAYIVKEDGVSDKTVTLTQVNKVPAGTGLVLKGTANAEYILTTYEGDGDDVSGNKMLGSATAETIPATGAAYILYDGEFHPWNGEGKIVAGKAYLNVSSGNAKALSINFADTTGISNAEDSETSVRDNDKMYNLGGQLVGEGYKGIVIVNGKKVIK